MSQPNSPTEHSGLQAAGGGGYGGPPGGYGPPPGGAPPPGGPPGGFGGPPAGGGGFGAPPGGGFGGPPPGGGGFGAPPPGGGGYGPAPQGFGGPGGFGAPPPGAPPGVPPGGGDVENAAQTWFIISIVTTLLCCLPAGIIGIIMTNEAKSMAQRGDYAGAEAKLGTGKIACIVGIVGTVLLGGVWFVLALVGAML